MRKMKKVLSLAMTAAMTASLLTGMGSSYSFCEEIGRWKKNEDYCFIKFNRIDRTVSGL